jgi:hypothetical protein
MPSVFDYPQGTELYLSIYNPSVLFSAQINNPSAGIGDRTIYMDNITAGSIGSIFSGSTALFGTQPGWDNVGRSRVKYAYSTGTMAIAENSLGFQDNQYVTVINQVDVNPIYPRIINNPNNAEDVIFYKDYDIPYSNQNSVMGSLICMGDHHAAFLVTGSVNVYYTATGTSSVIGDTNSYLWEFAGGSPSTSTAETPGNVSYNTPGHHVTKLTVTGNQGAVDVSYRYISIYNKPGQGSFVPIINWEMQGLSGSRSEGGYTVSMIVRQQIDQVQPNAVVVLFADEFYGTASGSIGGKPNREGIKFVGYILEDSIEYDYLVGTVSFQVGSITALMKVADGFSVSCQTDANPDKWYKIQDMTVLKAIYHYLRWHSTINLVADVQYTGENLPVQYFDSDRTSLYDSINSFVSSGLKGVVVSDRGGKLWIETNPEGRVDPLAIPSMMNIYKRSWIGSPNIRERRTAQTSFIEMGGIAYSGINTGTFSALITNAPSETPAYRGKPKNEKGFILSGQDALNQIVGNYLAMDNSKFYEIDFSLSGNYSNLDIAPIQAINPIIEPEDTPRNVRISGEKYVIDSMDWSYDPLGGTFFPSMTVKHITTGTPGVTVIVPDIPDDSGYSVPSLQIPPYPPIAFPPLSTSLPSGTVAQIAQNEINNYAADYADIGFEGGVGIFTNSNGITPSNGYNTPHSSPLISTATVSKPGLYWISLFMNGDLGYGETVEPILKRNGTIIALGNTRNDDVFTGYRMATAQVLRVLAAGDVITGQAQYAAVSSPFVGSGGWIIFSIVRISA